MHSYGTKPQYVGFQPVCCIVPPESGENEVVGKPTASDEPSKEVAKRAPGRPPKNTTTAQKRNGATK